MTQTITRDELGHLLEQEAHPAIAERIRAGDDAQFVMSNGSGKLRKALRTSRYHDSIARNAIATFEAIVTGELQVVDNA